MTYTAQPRLVAILAVFAIAYSIYIVGRLRQRRFDLYDFLLLESLALAPLIFVALPPLAPWIARTMGVITPFAVLFGFLFLMAFLGLHRAISRLHRTEERLVTVVQELALLKLQVDAAASVRPAADATPASASPDRSG